MQAAIALPPGLFHQKPAALNGVAGVEGAVDAHARVILPFGAHGFQGHPAVLFAVELEDLIHAPACAQAVGIRVFGVGVPHHGAQVQVDHGARQAAQRAGFGVDFGAEARGVSLPLVQPPDEVIAIPGLVHISALAGELEKLGARHGIEGFGKAVAALPQGLAIPGDLEIHAVAQIVVDTVPLCKIQAALGKGAPGGVFAVDIAEFGKGPGAAPLHPHGLVGGVDLAGPVEAGEDAAKSLILAVCQPEVEAGCQFIFHPGSYRLKRLMHVKTP